VPPRSPLFPVKKNSLLKRKRKFNSPSGKMREKTFTRGLTMLGLEKRFDGTQKLIKCY